MRTASLEPGRIIPYPMCDAIVTWLQKYPAIPLGPVEWADTFCLATGVYAPLTGFQGRLAAKSVLERWHLPSGAPWSIPITLSIEPQLAASLRKTDLARLVYQNATVAMISVEDVFWLDPEDEAVMLYGTTNRQHPGVERLLQASPVRIAGSVTLIKRPEFPVSPVLTPRETRTMIAQRGWRQVVGFQTRNPLHRAHEYIQKVALETHDGLILHPLVGYTKSDDVPLDVRWQAYQILLDQYFPKERTLLTGFPAPMRYAGPREAVFHALCRKNYGITHFIVGRDHAGVSNFYDPQASQKIFERFNQAELGISIITADPAFYCHRCQQMATARSCPHDAVDHEVLSGTRIRTTLGAGGNLPPVAIRPEVEVILQQYYRTPL